MGVSNKDGAKAAPLATGWTEVPRQTALNQLTRILDSLQFRSSKRCSTFLRHVVEHALGNNLESLKERSLGVEVFGRDAHYDTNQDPVVRSTAGEVRKRLAQYYLEADHRDEIRISLPAGSYSPEIHPSPEKSPEKPAEKTTPVVAVEAEPPPRPRRRWWIAAIAIGATLAAAGFIFVAPLLRKTDLDRFWAPVVDASSPVVMCVGQPKTYKFESHARQALENWIENGSKEGNPGSASVIPFSKVKPVWDRYVSLVDVQALVPLSDLLARKGKKVEIRGWRVSSLADLRGRPCVFIGAFNNDWTLRLTSGLRFYFELEPSNDLAMIRDRQDPNRKDWIGSRNWPAPQALEADYAIVSRIYNPTIEQTVVSVAGATGYGTYAAGEFLTNQEYFAAAVRGAPRDWFRKNMQVVLSVQVISGTPGPPKVLAVHFW
ncbi:MAG TPA: hypothetical protein VGL53_29305 [Bryobacteraceae bacterium]